MTYESVNRSWFQARDKRVQLGAELFHVDGDTLPLVTGCSAWLACSLIAQRYNQLAYDLFIGEVTGAWADNRVFNDGH